MIKLQVLNLSVYVITYFLCNLLLGLLIHAVLYTIGTTLAQVYVSDTKIFISALMETVL